MVIKKRLPTTGGPHKKKLHCLWNWSQTTLVFLRNCSTSKKETEIHTAAVDKCDYETFFDGQYRV